MGLGLLGRLGFVRNGKLRQALSFHSLLVGGNPLTTSALYALIHKLERDGGVWFAMGGTHALVRAMAAQLERLGGTIRLADPVEVIETSDRRATAIRTRSGWRTDFDAVASNADVVPDL
jgi:phytoene desaturase